VRRGSCVSFVIVLAAAIVAVGSSAEAQSLPDAAFSASTALRSPPGPVGAWQTAVSPQAAVQARDPLWTAISLSAAKMRIAHASIGPSARLHDLDAQRGPRLTGPGHGLIGLASYYGQGEVTATGERFDPSGMTAAHRTLPFGTRVRVTRVDTGNSIVVRINDRGPFKPGRVIDLSAGAAENLGITGVGLAQVRLEVLGR
jgi:rare lipoprotein A